MWSNILESLQQKKRITKTWRKQKVYLSIRSI